MRETGLLAAALRRLVDAPFADAVVGDLLEERARRARTGRPRRAHLWFLRALVAVTLYTAAAALAAAIRHPARRTSTMDRWMSDLRSAVRSLRAAPSFTVVALAVLTLGIGASTAIFSVVDAVVLRGLPFDGSHRLVAVSDTFKGTEPRHQLFTPAIFLDWRARQDVFTGLAAVADEDLNVDREGSVDPVILHGQRVSAAFFDILHVRPLVGRTFTADDEVDGRDDVAVISDGLRQRRFGSANAIGQRLHTPNRTIEIVGVMPRGFEYPAAAAQPTDIWTPYVVTTAERERRGGAGYRLEVIGRLRDGVSIEAAQARMDQISATLAAQFPDSFKSGRGALVEPLQGALSGGVRSWMLLLLGAVACVLLIACANVANLTLVRAGTRTHERGVRAALGATRWDLARPLLVESLLLAAVGAVLGVLLAYRGVDVLRAAIPPGVPRATAIAVNLRVLGAAGITALGTGLFFGLVPVLQFSRPNTGELLKDGGRATTAGVRRRWVGPALIVAEMALAVVLTVGAGLFIASFSRVAAIDIGLDVTDVSTVAVHPWIDRAMPEGRTARIDQGVRQVERIVQRVATLPGISAAAAISGVAPLSGATGTTATPFSIPGRTLAHRGIPFAAVSPDYFRVLRVPVLRGRAFTAGDREGAQAVVLLNATAASTYFGSVEAAVGQTVTCGACGRTPAVVVGVVGDIRLRGPEAGAEAMLYAPFARGRSPESAVLLLRAATAAPLQPAIRQAVWTEFPDLGLANVRTLDSALHDYTARREFNMLLLGLFGLLGLVIASVGLYGVMASHVTQRTQEIGIRMALGALPGRMLRSVLGRATVYLTCGLALGLAGAWMLSGLVASFLFQIEPTAPRVYAAGAGVLVLVGLVAALVPALRAARVDPLAALRAE
jgi:putative ABC transport system permease protein